MKIWKLGLSQRTAFSIFQVRSVNGFKADCNITSLSRFKHTDADEKTKQPVKKEAPPVEVVLEHGKVVTMRLNQAESLARKKDMKLLPVNENNKEMPIFKLVTGAEFYKVQMEQKRSKKEEHEVKHHEKHFAITHKIASHDLHSKLNQVKKWLAKDTRVEAVISFVENEEAKAEALYHEIEESLKGEGRLLQKRIKNNAIKFHMLPVNKENR